MEYTFQHAQWERTGKSIRASLYITQKTPAPWIIMCHGFTSHRIGPNYFFVSLARFFAAHGICVNAFDFLGCGESDGAFSDITISSLCADCVSACQYVQEHFQPSKIVLLGHSFGGSIAVLAAPALSVDGLILISPVADTKKHALTHEHILAQGTNELGCYEYGPHELKFNFLKELRESDPVAAVSNEVCENIILFQGDSDQQISIQESSAYIERAKQLNMDPAYHILADTDHRYSSVQSRQFLQRTIVTWMQEKVL